MGFALFERPKNPPLTLRQEIRRSLVLSVLLYGTLAYAEALEETASRAAHQHFLNVLSEAPTLEPQDRTGAFYAIGYRLAAIRL